MYLSLRESCERAGIPMAPGVTPLVLLTRIQEGCAAAVGPAERVIDLYLRARYGRRVLGESELREMSQALGAARKILRVKG